MRFFIASLILLCLLPASAQTTPPLSLHDLKEAETLGADLYNNTGATGLVLVVVRGNQVFFHGYGETAPGSHQAPTMDSEIRLCSLTKTFTTDLLTKLVADHTLNLGDPLQRYAPKGVVVPQRDKPITLLDLATHTAGLPREIGTAPRHTPHFTYPDYATRWDWLPKQTLNYVPGTVAFYSNIGFDLLSDALADAAHEPYPTLLDQRTLKPLHMWQTTFFPTDAQCARLMRGYAHEGPCTTTVNTMGSSGLYSTPEDMAKWLKYLLGTGGPAEPAQPAAARSVYLVPAQLISESGLSHAGRPSGIGLAWLHLRPADDPEHIIEKTGGGAGFLTYVAIHPASHTALFVAVTDSRPGAGTGGFNLFRASNDAVLELAGLPPLPREFRLRHSAPHLVRTSAHRARSTHHAGSAHSTATSHSARTRRVVRHRRRAHPPRQTASNLAAAH